jgi:undecaprenyl-diphosphatase
MNYFHAIVLGALKGITEFIPVSSSAHLTLVPWLFKWPEPGLAFNVFLHLGALTALFGYFFNDWWALFFAGLQSILERKIGFDRERGLFWLIVVGTIPGAVAATLFHEQAEISFRSPLLIAITLSSVGFLLYWIDGKYAALKNLDEIRMGDALWIGLAQALSMIPGVSPTGSTMGMGRLRGLNREAAARFSFMLCLPMILTSVLVEGRRLMELTSFELPLSYLLTGFGAALVGGILSIHFMLQYLRTSDFRLFAWYRMLLAAFIVFWSLFSHG